MLLTSQPRLLSPQTAQSLLLGAPMDANHQCKQGEWQLDRHTALFCAHRVDELIIGHKSYSLINEENEAQNRWVICLKPRGSSVAVRRVGKKPLW